MNVGVTANFESLDTFDGFNNFGSQFQSSVIRSVIGMVLIISGFVVRTVGARGVAGSGLVLDPERARKDVEPLSRMTGGVIKDTLDEVGIQFGNTAERVTDQQEQDFATKLRKLNALYQEGILTQAEYEKEKKRILDKI